MFVLFIFFVTWVVTSKALAKSKKTVNNNKEDIGEVIQLIQDLAHDQFSKAMRMYRDLIRRDLDRKIKNEEFFHGLPAEHHAPALRAEVLQRVPSHL